MYARIGNAGFRNESWGRVGHKAPPAATAQSLQRAGGVPLRLSSEGLLGGVPLETLHGSECGRISGIGFQSGTVFANRIRDAALLFVQFGETEVRMIVDW